jgi:hypothetical protein
LDYRTANTILREIHLRKDWSIQWFLGDGLTAGQHTILCQIRGLVPDSSSYPLYEKKSIATAHFVVRLDEVHTPQELLRIVMDNVCLMAIHEEREFTRFGPTWLAPFHPHRPDGQKLWVATSPKSILPRAAADPIITVEES